MSRFGPMERVKGIMERLGVEEDVPIEAGVINRSIEGAQTRVEGFNFDTRKHVVEYDDVINRQRETIYAERERILRSNDLSPTVLQMLDEEVRSLVAEHAVGDYHGDWNLEGLRLRIATMVPSLTPEDLAWIDEVTDRDLLARELSEQVAEQYERKATETGDDGMRILERLVLLRVIDSLWVEHLTAVDDMRRGIGLRAYSQRDPLNEFKVEAYQMFEELKATIRHDVTHTVFRVTVTREPVQQTQPRQMTESRPDVAPGANAASATAAAANGNGSSNGAQQPKRGGPKIGRNDPCFCGSGKKYKRCHGA
jgi:preprotein translocase subunit SecA